MIFTLGHSTLDRDEFARAARGIDVIVDTRSHPGSRHVPHFNKGRMEIWLPEKGFGYEWWPELGGWHARHCEDPALVERMAAVGVDIAAYSRGVFPRQRIGVARPDSGEDGPAWINQGLHDYSWYTSLPEFLTGVDHLIHRFGDVGINCAIICCEALYWKCHRSMIADHLHYRGVWCSHLPVQPPKRPTTPRWKLHSDVIGDRIERYPFDVLKTWHRWCSGAYLTVDSRSSTIG